MSPKATWVFNFIMGAIFLSLIACNKPNLKEHKGQYSYAVGLQIARNLKSQGIDLDQKAFSAAFADVYAGKDPQLSDEQSSAALRKMSEGLRQKEAASGEENLKKGKEFLEANKTKEGIKVTESGLQYKVIQEGKGKSPTSKSTVQVHYKGSLIDGKEFDSSYSRNVPAEFPVGGVIPGWTEALQLMKPGAKYELFIPADLAYGPQGNPSIPPNSVLIFEVELLKIIK